MMRRTITLLLALCLLLTGAASAETDLSPLETSEAVAEYLDDNGIDTVWRPLTQPFIPQVDEGTACCFLDIVELANEELLVLRFTVSFELDEPLFGDDMTLTLEKESRTFPVEHHWSEYDLVYQEDCLVYLAGSDLDLVKRLAGKGDHSLAFTVRGSREIHGTVVIPGAMAAEIWDLYRAAGGDRQGFSGWGEE